MVITFGCILYYILATALCCLLESPRFKEMKAKKSNIITVRFSDMAHEKLKAISGSTGVSVSDLIRICVQGELPRIEEKYVGGESDRTDG